MRRIIVGLVLPVCLFCCASCGSTVNPTDNGPDVDRDIAVNDDGVSDPGSPDVFDVRDVVDPDASDLSDIHDAVDSVEVPDVRPDVTEVVDVQDDSDAADARDVTDVQDDGGIEPCVDDGLACTVEARGEDGECFSTIMENWCLIEGVCYEDGAVNLESLCFECVVESSTSEWTVMFAKVCDDLDLCTLNDACNIDGVCFGTGVVCTDDGNSCTQEYCDLADGQCKATVLPNGRNCLDDGNQCTLDRCSGGTCIHSVWISTCNDGDACTTGDTCNAQAECKGIAKNCPDDGNICTDNGCNPLTGQCRNDLINDGRDCDDLDYCTVDDGCYLGQCTGANRDCADTDRCTSDLCVDGPAGYCTHDVMFGSCDDGNACTINEACGGDGICKGGVLITCNDFNSCTNDTCNEATGCVYTANSNPCTDNNSCTLNDVCTNKVCVGTPVDCDDENDCTTDSCFEGNCRHTPVSNGLPCDDNNVCTTNGTCSSGDCVSSGAVDCADTNACTLDGCDAVTGCTHSTIVCNDSNNCTTDSCNTTTGCVYTPNSIQCNDSDPCTEFDICALGECAGSPLDCGDNDPCTLDECNGGVCANPPNLGSCDDGNACTEGEQCFSGVCSGGETIVCRDSSDCTTDTCNTLTGCVFTPLSGPCDDGTVCTLNDRCQGGLCVGDRISCNDGNYCTDDLCHPLDGCYGQNNALLCDDLNPCTIMDVCGAAQCNGMNTFRNPVVKAATYLIGSDGNTGNGLDVDANSGTCMPAGKCENGIDNAFAGLTLMVKDQFNPDLTARVASGDLAMVLEIEEPGPVGSPYDIKMLFGHKTAPTTCNAASTGCNYLVFKDDTIGQCTPRYAFDNATTIGQHVVAGGTDYQTVVYFMIGSYPMPVALKWARIEADVTVVGNMVTGGSGILGGAINKVDFKYALQSVPEIYFSPYTRAQVIQNVDQTLTTDADVDGNTTKESASIGIKFTITTGNVTGRTN